MLQQSKGAVTFVEHLDPETVTSDFTLKELSQSACQVYKKKYLMHFYLVYSRGYLRFLFLH